MRNNAAKQMALGGVLAGLAVVIMTMGGLIPLATFILPLLCIILCCIVLKLCGTRIAWAWYGAVAILSLLLGPDKEAAAVFLMLGYYPIVKPYFDGLRLGFLLKLVYFNAVIAIVYTLLLYLLGMTQIANDYRTLGAVGLAVTLLLGNVTFILQDIVITRVMNRR